MSEIQKEKEQVMKSRRMEFERKSAGYEKQKNEIQEEKCRFYIYIVNNSAIKNSQWPMTMTKKLSIEIKVWLPIW